MKFQYILGGIIAVGMLFPISVNAQDSHTNETMTASAKRDSTGFEVDDDPDAMNAIFAKATPTSTSTPKRGCSLIKNKWSDRKMYNLRNGYRLETQDQSESITVRHKRNGSKKISYFNEFETLDYHLKSNGQVHYTYTYMNECKKVKFRRNKKGETTLHNNSELDTKEIRNNVNDAIRMGVMSCSNF